jgi:hypothetical protein
MAAFELVEGRLQQGATIYASRWRWRSGNGVAVGVGALRCPAMRFPGLELPGASYQPSWPWGELWGFRFTPRKCP